MWQMKGGNMKHLHQPWKRIYDFKNEGENYVDIYDNREVKFASIYCIQKEDSEIRSNLFQSAPELLREAKSSYDIINHLLKSKYFKENSVIKQDCEAVKHNLARIINKFED